MRPRPPERIETERLVLRRWREEDAETLHATLEASLAHLSPWVLFVREEPRSVDATFERLCRYMVAFETGAQLHYAIERDGALLGEVMLLDRVGPDAIELGYWLAHDATGQGYATEACRPLVELALGPLARERVVLRCDEHNAPSLRVAERLGAVPVGREDAEDGVTLVVLERRNDAR